MNRDTSLHWRNTKSVFWTAKKSLFIDYSGAKYARFIPKNTVALKALFLVAENSGFAV